VAFSGSGGAALGCSAFFSSLTGPALRR
jgi:hypothetical protein